jgi:hypothetical protein
MDRSAPLSPDTAVEPISPAYSPRLLPRLHQGARPEHLTGEADPAAEFARIFGDDATSSGQGLPLICS